MGNVTLLDCTLRDGTHINNGNFGENVIKGTIDNLVKANIDIIEIGFWDNEKHNSDYTYFSSIEDVKKVLPKSLGNSKISIMADFVDMSTVEPYDGTVEYFRLSFKRSRWDWAIKSAKILMEKGYKVFINPVNCNVYSKEEYIEAIKKVNELKPYGFSIVDTFGVFRKQTLTEYYSLVEQYLDKDIVIGLHLHENLGLSLSIAQHFLEIHNKNRNINIDCSLLGMGRTPGNLSNEQIAEHMNENYHTEYNTEFIYDACDDYIAPIKRQYGWGYAIPYALSGKFGLHRTYAEFLMNKNRLKTKDIQRILSKVDKDHIELFDEQYIEKLYKEYVSVEYDDSKAIEELGKTIKDKDILVVCPGHTINEYKGVIINKSKEKDMLTVSVNFIPDFVDIDYSFCANIKRIDNIAKSNNRIITSNLKELVDGKYIFSYNDNAFYSDSYCEDSTVVLLRILDKCKCNNVYLAGFDGFSDNNQTYYRDNYTKEIGKNVDRDLVKYYLTSAINNIKLHFITPSKYEDK